VASNRQAKRGDCSPRVSCRKISFDNIWPNSRANDRLTKAQCGSQGCTDSGNLQKMGSQRVCYEGSGASRALVSRHEWERRFRTNWDTILRAIHLPVEVFIWSDEPDLINIR
jgi:hypothetical protein